MKAALFLVVFLRYCLAIRRKALDEPDTLNNSYPLYVTVPDGSIVVANVTVPACQKAEGKIGCMLMGTPYGSYKNSTDPTAMFAASMGFVQTLAIKVPKFFHWSEPSCPAFVMYEEEGTWVSEKLSRELGAKTNAENLGAYNLWSASTGNQKAIVKQLNEQPWSNGVVIPTGMSAMGIRSFLAGNVADEANIRAQIVMIASPDTRTAGFTNGVLNTGVVEHICAVMGLKQEEFAPLAQQHEDPGPFWDTNSFSDWQRVNWPTHMFAAWFDIFAEGQLVAWGNYRAFSQASVRDLHSLIVSPLGHCAMGLPAADLPQLNIDAIAWQWLTSIVIIQSRLVNTFSGAASDSDYATALGQWASFIKQYPRVVLYVFSAKGDYLTALSDMPTYTPAPFYFRSGKSSNLSSTAPSEGAVTFTYDPSDPVFSHGGRLFNDAKTPCGPLDQRSVRRNYSDKLLFFTSSVFSEPYAISGPVVASLVVGSTATDTDFVVKLVDVRPSGEEYLVASGIARMAYRDGNSKKPIVPGKNYINITMSYASWIFERGSKLGVILTSSDANGYRVNPNTGGPLIIPETGNIFPQTGQTNITAENKLYFGLSSIKLPSVDVADLPRTSMSDLPYRREVAVLYKAVRLGLNFKEALSEIGEAVEAATTEVEDAWHHASSWLSRLWR